ncbi:MAG: CHASE2 domain-containing protein [Pseudomonadota bacterium]
MLFPVLLFGLVALCEVLGAFEPLNRTLMDMRFRLIEREPSRTLVVVEIDPHSLNKEANWPWPRDRYAEAILNLQDAGAALIAFDVDFSSRSDLAGDASFVDALSLRPGEVALPVFWQWSHRSGDAGEIIRTTPHAVFLQDAVVASVTMTPEKNGVVRRGWSGFQDGDEFRPSIAATLAGTPGAGSETFYIDYSIDASKIPRLSFHDVINGDFDGAVVKGKNILIGATALELGDEFATPVDGVVPGVDLHALSYESLVQNRALTRPHSALPLLFAFVVIVVLNRGGARRGQFAAIATHLTVFAIVIVAPVALQAAAPVSFDTGAVLAAQGFSIICGVVFELRQRMRQILQHRLESARYRALAGIVVTDNLDGVVVANAQGRVELCNDRAKEFLGVSEDAQDALSITELAPGFPVHPAAAPAGPTSPDSVAPVSTEYRVPGRDDLVLEVVVNCVRNDEVYRQLAAGTPETELFVYTLRNISVRKRIEAAERDAKNAAIAANKLKTQLISNMSHELRTPLNGVIGFAGILREESFGALGAPEYKEYAENIHTSGKRLLGLVNDMLTIAKLDANEFSLEKEFYSIADVIDGCLSAYEAQLFAEKKSVSVDVQKDLPQIEFDFRVLREMLSHLISNAIKFTKAGGRIGVSASRDEAALIIEVTDDGCGVDAAAMPKLTEAFYQADGDLARAHEGAGLGLYIVSKYAALHGGAVELESQKGEGFVARLRFENTVMKSRSRAA